MYLNNSSVFRSKSFWSLIIIFALFYIFTIRSTTETYQNLNISKRYLSSKLGIGTRLGNHLFELTSLVGIARSLNRTLVFFVETNGNKKELEEANKTMPGLIDQYIVVNEKVPSSIRNTIFHTRCCIYEDPRVLQHIPDEHLRLTGTLYQSYKYFPGMRNEILGWLKKPTSSFDGLPKSDALTHVTCVHARRGDFVNIGFQAANDHFIREAVKYISEKEKIKKIRKSVVLFGDDVKFMKSVFNNSALSKDNLAQNPEYLHFVSQNSPQDDIFYARSNCDVVLISASHSTFGWWMGFLSKNNRVYYMDMRVYFVGALKAGKINIKDYFLPEWTPLKFASDNTTIIIGDK